MFVNSVSFSGSMILSYANDEKCSLPNCQEVSRCWFLSVISPRTQKNSWSEILNSVSS